MFLFPTKVLYFLQLSDYSWTDGFNFFFGYVTHYLKMVLIVYRVFFQLSRKTAAKAFIFKPFKHWPDRMSAFKRHLDPEHGVHNKYMFDNDQLISRLKSKSVFIDVSVMNSLSKEKVLKKNYFS